MLDSVLYPPPDPRGSTVHVHTASWASMVRIPRAPRYPGALSCCMPSRRSIAGPSGQGVAAATVANSQCHHSGPPGTQHSDISTAQVREDALVFLWFESVTSLQSQSPTASALSLGPLAPSQRKTQEIYRKLHSYRHCTGMRGRATQVMVKSTKTHLLLHTPSVGAHGMGAAATHTLMCEAMPYYMHASFSLAGRLGSSN